VGCEFEASLRYTAKSASKKKKERKKKEKEQEKVEEGRGEEGIRGGERRRSSSL
jgi:hypothetical protein